MIATAAALGALIGLVIGALGGGGSVLTVPLLVYALGQSPQEATSSSLVIVGVTAAVASVGSARRGGVQWSTGVLLGVAGVPATFLGTLANRHVAPQVLLLAFAVLMLVAAAGLLLRADADHEQRPGPAAASGGSRPGAGRWLRLLVAGLGIGVLTGFLGVGGGFVIVPVLVLAMRLPMPVAVGTSLLVISLNSGVALLARIGSEHVNGEVILPFTGAAVLASLAGGLVAQRVRGPALTRAFAVLLVLVAGYVGAQAALG